jgi:hypothetical protein
MKAGVQPFPIDWSILIFGSCVSGMVEVVCAFIWFEGVLRQPQVQREG